MREDDAEADQDPADGHRDRQELKWGKVDEDSGEGQRMASRPQGGLGVWNSGTFGIDHSLSSCFPCSAETGAGMKQVWYRLPHPPRPCIRKEYLKRPEKTLLNSTPALMVLSLVKTTGSGVFMRSISTAFS